MSKVSAPARTQASESVSTHSNQFSSLQRFSGELLQSIFVLRWVGYGLILFTLLDVAEVFIPSQFMNQNWEFQMLGALVERVPVPLIGLGLIFLGEKRGRTRLEKQGLYALSWLSLLVAVLFILLVPLGALNTVRINEANSTQVNSQLSESLAELELVSQQLETAQSPEQMNELLSLVSVDELPVVRSQQDVQDARAGLEEAIAAGRTSLNQEAQATISSRRKQLIKQSVKWNAGAVIAGAIFFQIWRGTTWARRP